MSSNVAAVMPPSRTPTSPHCTAIDPEPSTTSGRTTGPPARRVGALASTGHTHPAYRQARRCETGENPSGIGVDARGEPFIVQACCEVKSSMGAEAALVLTRRNPVLSRCLRGVTLTGRDDLAVGCFQPKPEFPAGVFEPVDLFGTGPPTALGGQAAVRRRNRVQVPLTNPTAHRSYAASAGRTQPIASDRVGENIVTDCRGRTRTRASLWTADAPRCDEAVPGAVAVDFTWGG